MESWMRALTAALPFLIALPVAAAQHMTGEQPRILFLHSWGTGTTQDLARGLRTALDRTATRLGAR